jgi:hypothetical protein
MNTLMYGLRAYVGTTQIYAWSMQNRFHGWLTHSICVYNWYVNMRICGKIYNYYI